MNYYGDDYSYDYDYAPRGMDDEDFHEREQRENAEAIAHEEYMDRLRMEEEAKYWEEVEKPHLEWLGRYYPLNWIDDHDPMTDLNDEIQSDGIDDAIYYTSPDGTSEQVLELVERSSDEVKILFYAMTSGVDYSERLNNILGNKYYSKAECEVRYLIAVHELNMAPIRLKHAKERMLSFMSPPQHEDIPF